jgi:hypothetical protein
MTVTKSTPILTETIAVRLTLDECRALFDIAHQADRTVSYIVRAQLRNYLRKQQRGYEHQLDGRTDAPVSGRSFGS